MDSKIKSKEIVKWLFVLPISLIITILSQFVIHLVLYQTLTGSGFIEPYPEFPERFLVALISPFLFMFCCIIFSPKYNNQAGLFAGILLFSYVLLYWGGYIVDRSNYMPLYGGFITGTFVFSNILGICLCLIATFPVKDKQIKEN